MSSSKSNKIHPIYVALDSHQYNRAIKLCQALPPTNELAQCLLVSAYNKSNQRYRALTTLYDLLRRIDEKAVYPELEWEIRCTMEARTEPSITAPSTPEAPTVGKKSYKKGKRKPTSAAPASEPTVDDRRLQPFDYIDQLDHPPIGPADWIDQIQITAGTTLDPEVLLSSLPLTFLHQLRLPLTAYQLYGLAASTHGTIRLLTQAYVSAIGVAFLAPTSPCVQVLEQAQTWGMKMLRLDENPSWAIQAILWQLELKPDNALQCRLAESLASKACRVEYEETLIVAETFWLYLDTLEIQNKWSEMSEALEERIHSNKAAPPKHELFNRWSQVLIHLEDYPGAQSLLQNHLLPAFPDNWDYWMRYLDCCVSISSDGDQWMVPVESLVDELLESQSGKYPLRAPHLVLVEIADRRESVSDLVQQIKNFADRHIGQVACVFSDLRPYVKKAVTIGSEDTGRALCQWLQSFNVDQSAVDLELSRQLRAFVTATQLSYEVFVAYPALEADFMVDWRTLVRLWDFVKSSENSEQAQKESRPSDDLLLLATQQLLRGKPPQDYLVLAGCLLEQAIQHSPYNPYLKITAMFVFAELSASDKSWEAFRQLYIKHIQYESCAYLILPLLHRGCQFDEVIAVCQEILRLQTNSSVEALLYSGKALQNGAIRKGREFITFHRSRLMHSLTTLDAKGLLLDYAPLFRHDSSQEALGAVHGIVGGDHVERAWRMVSEVHNPKGSFSLLQLQGNAVDFMDVFSDNRDMTVLSNDILFQRAFDSISCVVESTIRRSVNHMLLIKASLCTEAIKGPKKGKIVKPSADLLKCCSSLVSTTVRAKGMVNQDNMAHGYGIVLSAICQICSVLTILGAGTDIETTQAIESITGREDKAKDHLASAMDLLRSAKSELHLSNLSDACRSVPDLLVPVYATLKMAAKALDAYGWGKRKTTKSCSVALSKVATCFLSIVEDCRDLVARSEEPLDVSAVLEEVKLQDSFAAFSKATVSSIEDCQAKGKERVLSVLNTMANDISDYQMES